VLRQKQGAHAQRCGARHDVSAVAQLCLEPVFAPGLLKGVGDSREDGGAVGLDVGLAEEERAVHVDVLLDQPGVRGFRGRLKIRVG
jgi:hypothetical protein